MAPIIINACREFTGKITPPGGGTYPLVTVDFNLTTFGYTINKCNPKTQLTVMVEDSYSKPMIIVGVPFFKEDLFFKITFDFDDRSGDWIYKLEYCRDRWGHDVIDIKDVTLPLASITMKFIELNGIIERLVKFGTSSTFMTISMQDRCESDEEEDVDVDVEEEADEEKSDETSEEQPVHKMKRFFGMMPVKEIERTEEFMDDLGFSVRIDAGPNGWTVRFADMSSSYKDESIGTEANFKNAYDTAVAAVGKLTPVDGTSMKEDVEK
jgi:hypothetical protein